jgi:hypothetical protein
VKQLAVKNESLQVQASELRDQSQTARGDASLELLKQANELSRQVSENNDSIGKQMAEEEAATLVLAQVSTRMASNTLRIEAMDARLAAVQASAAESGEFGKAQQAKIGAARNSVQTASTELANEFKAAYEAFEQSQQAYGRAISVNAAASGSADKISQAATAVVRENPETSAKPTLTLLGGTGGKAAILFQKSRLLTDQADSVSRMLNTFAQIEAVRDRIASEAGVLKTEVPNGIKDALALVADSAAVRKSAADQYDEAAAVAQVAASNSGAAMKAVLWTYQGQQALALLGKYQLTQQPEALDQARTLVTTILQENEGNPHVEPIRQIGRMLAAASGA